MKAILTWWWCARRDCLKGMSVVAWKLGHSVENRKFGIVWLLFPGLLLGGLCMSRTKLISNLYSGLLQASTSCLGPSLEIFFLQKYMFCLFLGIAKLYLSAMHLLVSRRQPVCAAARKGKGWEARMWEKIPFFFSHKELEWKTYYLLREIVWRLGDTLTFP